MKWHCRFTFRFLKTTLEVKDLESRAPSKHLMGGREKINQVGASVLFYLATGRSLKLPLKPVLQACATKLLLETFC